ncbi:MAG TPA: hypothetical protein VHX65_12780 [Pirellulales bacterium]|jgi:hypothetical protein|nr:hypothetical protein [Pirellulales bacterium]
MEAKTVDECSNVLHRLGWSCGDMAFNDGRAVVWQVFAHRGDQRIVVRAPRQGEAWAAATRQAMKVISVKQVRQEGNVL